uniref:C-type lectin domain-containing protein n=1 Tax=Periophthalmus magnuspinnatus TaxID=409849 RepID=A0A3B4B1S5_9GOBI
ILSVTRTCLLNKELRRIETPSNCGKCPRGWISFKTSCYYYSFSLSNSKKNWSDSRADCIRQGGDLVLLSNRKHSCHVVIQEVLHCVFKVHTPS